MFRLPASSVSREEGTDKNNTKSEAFPNYLPRSIFKFHALAFFLDFTEFTLLTLFAITLLPALTIFNQYTTLEIIVYR